MGMVELFPVEEQSDIDELKKLIQNHYEYTGSTVADAVLSNWDQTLPQFVKVFPTDYRRVLEEAAEAARMDKPLAEESEAEREEPVEQN